MNDLEKYFLNNKGRQIYKYLHYFDIYDRHFSKYRNKDVRILEIGVLGGGSLQMWKYYFGENAKIYGIDIDPICKDYEEENIKIFIGSQSDKYFLNEIKNNIPPVDIIIDDGGHMMSQQKISFQLLFEHLKPKGVYLCEDVHTSYFLKFGGGYKRSGTFIEYSKKFIDQLNAFYSEQKRFKKDDITYNVDSIHFYDSIVVFEKGVRVQPKAMVTGKENHAHVSKYSSKQKQVLKIGFNIVLGFNSILRFFRLPGFIIK